MLYDNVSLSPSLTCDNVISGIVTVLCLQLLGL